MTTVRGSRRTTLLVARILPLLLVFGIAGLPDTGRAETASAPAGQSRIQAGMIDLGSGTTCVVLSTGAVNCWGLNDYGQLGRGNTASIGDDETPASAGTLSLGPGVSASSITASMGLHTCVLTTVGSVKCWGTASLGRLGTGNATDLGDDETPATIGTVNIGGTATAITTGSVHTCALLSTGAVTCWGAGGAGRLGYGNTTTIGDDETPASAGTVNIGGTATAIAAGSEHTCALLSTGAVTCWGGNLQGQLGYGNTTTIGDNETPASAGTVNIGGTATAITAGDVHTCALLSTGAVTCWGNGASGQLGYGNASKIGDNETPASAGTVNIGGTATAIAAGQYHTCALLSTGAVTCWGDNLRGQLGYGNTTTIGDNETPASAGTVNIGGTATAIAAGVEHTCAVLTSGSVKCWGYGADGALGYSNSSSIGDDETPATVGAVDLGGVSALATTTTVATTLPPTTTSTAPSSSTTVATTLPATTTTTTISSTVSRGKSLSGASIAKLAKISVKSGSKISLKVSAATSSRCRVTGTSVKGLRAGACRVTITVKPRTGRSTVRTVTITVR